MQAIPPRLKIWNPCIEGIGGNTWREIIMDERTQTIRNTVQLIFFGLLLTGAYVKLKPVLILLLLLSLVVGNFFCGWVCPYGAAQELFGSVGDRLLKKKYKMPQGIQRYLQFSRYIIMIVTVGGIGVVFFEPLNSYKIFMAAEEILSGVIAPVSLIIMISFLVISILFERPFCNYFCIEATKYGIASLTRFFTITRNEVRCIKCEKCNKICPMNITVSHRKIIRNAQCINCFECINTCPERGTLSYKMVKGFLKKK